MSGYDLFPEIRDKYNSIPAEHYRKFVCDPQGVPLLKLKLPEQHGPEEVVDSDEEQKIEYEILIEKDRQ